MAMTGATGRTVAGYFESESQAERAIDALGAAGFKQNQIGVAASAHTGAGVGGDTAIRPESTGSELSGGVHAAGQKAGEEASGFWGKVKGFFDGGDVEPYADEREAGDLASHEVTPGTGSSYTSGYEADDLHHSLAGTDLATEHADYFGGRLRSSNAGVVVTVTAEGRAEEAARILQQNGADLGTDRTTETSSLAGSTAPATTGTEGRNIQLFGEVLRVHKDRISRGEVRLRKEIHTETQTIEVPVTREELVIERVPVSGETAVDGTRAFAGEEIRVPLSEERASVDKQAVVREEVRVGKRDVASTEHFDEQVRSEELKVDDETTTTGTVKR